MIKIKIHKPLSEDSETTLVTKNPLQQEQMGIWGSNTPLPSLPFDIPNWKPHQLLVEYLLENARKKLNPKAPSRFNCKFIFPSKVAKKPYTYADDNEEDDLETLVGTDEENFRKPKGLVYEHYYQVVFEGNTFQTDLEAFTEFSLIIQRVLEREGINFRKILDFDLEKSKQLAKALLTKNKKIFDYANDWAKQYWKGCEKCLFPEILVDGSVKAVKKLK
jgi:hypothetical protein